MSDWNKEVKNSSLMQFTKEALVANVLDLESENENMESEIKLALSRIGTSFNTDCIKEDLKRAIRIHTSGVSDE